MRNCKEITYIAPTNVMVMMSGVHHIEIENNVITLVYENGDNESFKDNKNERQGKAFFELVSFVQSKRP